MNRFPVFKTVLIPLMITLFIVWASTGCSSDKPKEETKEENFDLSQEDINHTGAVELNYRVVVERALFLEARQVKGQLMEILKENTLTFSGATLKEGNAIEISGLDKEHEMQLKDVLTGDFPGWNYQFSDGILLLSLKPNMTLRLKEAVMDQTVEVIKRRLKLIKVKSSIEKNPGSHTFQLKIPPSTDKVNARIKSFITTIGVLEFCPVIDGPVPVKEEALEKYNGTLPFDLKILKCLPNQNQRGYFVVKDAAVVSGRDIKAAEHSKDSFGAPSVTFHLNSIGARKFKSYTSKNIGQKLAIVLDEQVISAPTVNDVISESAVISGRFTLEEADELAWILNSGALPAPLELLNEKIIKPTVAEGS